MDSDNEKPTVDAEVVKEEPVEAADAPDAELSTEDLEQVSGGYLRR